MAAELDRSEEPNEAHSRRQIREVTTESDGDRALPHPAAEVSDSSRYVKSFLVAGPFGVALTFIGDYGSHVTTEAKRAMNALSPFGR